MTDQPKQDAIVSQRARAFAAAYWVDEYGTKDGHAAKILAGQKDDYSLVQMLVTYHAEIEAATIERCAEWYETKGWQMDEEEVPTAIRNLKGQTS